MDPILDSILEQNAQLRLRADGLQLNLNSFAQQVGAAIGVEVTDGMPWSDLVVALHARLEQKT